MQRLYGNFAGPPAVRSATTEFGCDNPRERDEMVYDIIGIITLLLVIWALIGILQSSASPVEKLIWVIIILVIPLIGFLLWYLIGPGSKAFPLRR